MNMLRLFITFTLFTSQFKSMKKAKYGRSLEKRSL